jgi:hypothetical protein
MATSLWSENNLFLYVEQHKIGKAQSIQFNVSLFALEVECAMFYGCFPMFQLVWIYTISFFFVAVSLYLTRSINKQVSFLHRVSTCVFATKKKWKKIKIKHLWEARHIHTFLINNVSITTSSLCRHLMQCLWKTQIVCAKHLLCNKRHFDWVLLNLNLQSHIS